MRPKSVKGTLKWDGGTLQFSATGAMIPELCDLIKEATVHGQTTIDDFDRFREAKV